MKIYLYPFVGLLLACAHDGQLPVEPEPVCTRIGKDVGVPDWILRQF